MTGRLNPVAVHRPDAFVRERRGYLQHAWSNHEASGWLPELLLNPEGVKIFTSFSDRSMSLIQYTRRLLWRVGLNFVEVDPMTNPFFCAIAATVNPAARDVDITLEDGKVYRCSLSEASERLRLVDSSLLADWEWIGPKAGMHWPAVDEDLSIEYLVANGVLHTQPVFKQHISSESVATLV